MVLGYSPRYYTECSEGTRRLVNTVLLRGLTKEVANTFVFVYGQVVSDYLSTLPTYLQQDIQVADLGIQHLQDENLFWRTFINARVAIDPPSQAKVYDASYIDAIFPDPQNNDVQHLCNARILSTRNLQYLYPHLAYLYIASNLIHAHRQDDLHQFRINLINSFLAQMRHVPKITRQMKK